MTQCDCVYWHKAVIDYTTSLCIILSSINWSNSPCTLCIIFAYPYIYILLHSLCVPSFYRNIFSRLSPIIGHKSGQVKVYWIHWCFISSPVSAYEVANLWKSDCCFLLNKHATTVILTFCSFVFLVFVSQK